MLTSDFDLARWRPRKTVEPDLSHERRRTKLADNTHPPYSGLLWPVRPYDHTGKLSGENWMQVLLGGSDEAKARGAHFVPKILPCGRQIYCDYGASCRLERLADFRYQTWGPPTA